MKYTGTLMRSVFTLVCIIERFCNDLIYRSVIIFVALLGFFVNTALAHTVITFTPGIAFDRNGETQTLLIDTSPQRLSNRYVANNNSDQGFVAQLFLGSDLFERNQYVVQGGVNFIYVDDANVSGSINQLALPSFNNLNFQYKVQSLSAMASANVLYLYNEQWQPYVTGGVGWSNNRAHAYTERARINGAVTMAPFKSNSRNSFAYSVGIGLRMKLALPFYVGVGYSFSDMGQANLGQSPAQSTNQTPSLNHVYLNQLLFNITWNS